MKKRYTENDVEPSLRLAEVLHKRGLMDDRTIASVRKRSLVDEAQITSKMSRAPEKFLSNEIAFA